MTVWIAIALSALAITTAAVSIWLTLKVEVRRENERFGAELEKAQGYPADYDTSAVELDVRTRADRLDADYSLANSILRRVEG
ncbi:hypothetical protein [Methylobacterium gnaphalii]|uniref:Uncharacterized protein n=1 Tax=Methylobacterium gnaphalii TaxID=1010610 RepID=A0A512JIS6_9HYPH|nr:hypothetical protein [Methylobacterium gnaphalii]GEP09860.1 hypothetical protein MGN01_17050 [Methylobacterium gnaphalii]GJD67225.1 hypothetical protein MMMDOFMJ_0139 [Methylobacterium gnaphalii]GLS49889.1 hypothetical protein GCM10007885_27410 [Methylobacterium gnaphalii]